MLYLSLILLEGVMAKIIKVNLSEKERKQLVILSKEQSNYRSKRALAVLHCDNGLTATKIAEILNLNLNTVCSYLRNFNLTRIASLERNYSSGRPSFLSDLLTDKITEYFAKSPRDYGWGEDVWTAKVIMAQFTKETKKNISNHTIIRTLKKLGYSFKKPKLTTPKNIISKEDKLKIINKIANNINNLKTQEDIEIMFLDESHFSAIPYVNKGWFRIGEDFFTNTQKARKVQYIWGIFYYEK